MLFYVNLSDDGQMSNVSKQSFAGSITVDVADKYSEYFDEQNVSGFSFLNGEPTAVAFPKNLVSFQQKIMQENLEKLSHNDNDFLKDFNTVQGIVKFVTETVMEMNTKVDNLEREVTDLKSKLNEGGTK